MGHTGRFLASRGVQIGVVTCSHARYHRACITVGFAILLMGLNASAQNGQVTISPTQGVLGEKYDVALTTKPAAAGANCTNPSLAVASTSLKIPQGSGVSLVGNPTASADNCTMVATISVDADAPVGTVNFQLLTTATPPIPLGLVPFQIVASIPGPIPPGLVPQVDVQWHVVNPNTTEDNFGHRVRKLFYCIQLTIGNNTGYDLQLSTVGFTSNQGNTPAFGNTDYTMVRGTLDWGQKTNLWNLATLSLEAAGPVLSATLPLVANSAKRGQRAQLIGLLSPFATAMAFIYPYQSSFSAQFKHLDDSSLRAGYVIHNNQQAVPVFLFVSKDNVPRPKINQKCVGSVWSTSCKCDDSDLSCIKQSLGKLVIVGESILYLNRVSVVAPPTPTLAPLVALNPSSLNFGNVGHSTVSPALSFTVTNTGDGPLTITSISETGADEALFDHSSTTGACATTPATLPAGASCTISVVFKPVAAATASATLNISDNAAGSPHTVKLTGTGT